MQFEVTQIVAECSKRLLAMISRPLLVACAATHSFLAPSAGAAQSQPGEATSSKDYHPAMEVVVTARRRPEPVETVPISITVLEPTDVSDISSKTFVETLRAVPNLVLPTVGVGGTIQPAIRGIFSPVGAATVGLYLDDTPIELRPLLSAGSPEPLAFDLERVEVLRGPQGTLFGASSLGGTIRFISRQPDLHKASGRLAFESSKTNRGGVGYQASGVIDEPIVANVIGLRTGILVRREAGYVDRVDALTGASAGKNVNTGNLLVGKAALRAQAGAHFTITPSILYQRYRYRDLPFFESSRGRHRQAYLTAQPGRDDFVLPALSLNLEAGNLAMTATSSYFRRLTSGISDYSTVFGELVLGGAIPGLRPAGGTRNITRSRHKNWTHEVRVSPKDSEGKLSWVFGVFHQQSSIKLSQAVEEPGITGLVADLFGTTVEELFGSPLISERLTYRGREQIDAIQSAVFGELSWSVTPKFTAHGGLRVSRSLLDLTVASDGPYAGPSSAHNQVRERRIETPVSPRIGISYRPVEPLSLYVIASHGYRAGGANTPVPAGPCAVDLKALGRQTSPASYGSDTVWSYELGAKMATSDVTIAGSAFQIDWQEVQQPIALPNCGFSFVDNLGAARNRGFEFESSVRLSPNISFSAGAGFVNARYRKTLTTGARPDEGSSLIVQRGDRLPFIPRWTINFAGEYRTPARRGRQFFANLFYKFASSFRRTLASPALSFDSRIITGAARNEVDFKVGLVTPSWTLALFANNLLNDQTLTYNSVELVPATGSPLRQATARPRALGVSASWAFGR